MRLPIIEPKDIPPGSGMFFNGKSDVNLAIQFLSVSRKNHFGFWTDKKAVAQAIGEGFLEQDLKDAISDTDVYVDVVQFCGNPKDMYNTYLGSRQYPYEPVMESCRALLQEGNMYDYPSLLLLAALCEVRRLQGGDIWQRLVTDIAFETVSKLIEATKIFQLIQTIISKGKRPIDCSASGYLTFANAGEKYRPIILPQSLQSVYDSIPIYDSELLLTFEEVWRAEKNIPYKFITPRDLWMSPNFCRHLGRLKYGNLSTDL
jgi:hypothetical protein